MEAATPALNPSRGTIKQVQHSFAFLTDDQGVDRFFHRSQLRSAADPTIDFTDIDLTTVLTAGLVVTFFPVTHAVKGPRAIRVTLVTVDAFKEGA